MTTLLMLEILIAAQESRDTAFNVLVKDPWLQKGKSAETVQNYYDMKTRDTSKGQRIAHPSITAPRAIRFEGDAFTIRRELRAHVGSRGTDQCRWANSYSWLRLHLNSIYIYYFEERFAHRPGDAFTRNRGASIISAYCQSLGCAAENRNPQTLGFRMPNEIFFGRRSVALQS